MSDRPKMGKFYLFMERSRRLVYVGTTPNRFDVSTHIAVAEFIAKALGRKLPREVGTYAITVRASIKKIREAE